MISDKPRGTGTKSVGDYGWLWKSWIAPEYIDGSRLCEIKAASCEVPHYPLHLCSFLLPEVARGMASLLAAIPIYQRIHAIITPSGDVEEVDESVWNTCSAARHWHRHDIARPLTRLGDEDVLAAANRSLFAQFVLFAARGPLFRTWLSIISGHQLSDRVSFEISRYNYGDFIVPHDDLVSSRRISVNLYLDPEWSIDKGGQLGFRNSTSRIYEVLPVFNSISVIPIAAGCTHWVGEWLHPQPGRQTISLGYHAAE